MNYTNDPYYDNGLEDAETFDDLSQQIQDDLLEWYNVQTPNNDDKELLLKLYLDNNFRAWNCEDCGDRVFDGNPDNWDSFQSTLNRDFSYFGNRDKYQPEYLEALCDNCRMHSN